MPTQFVPGRAKRRARQLRRDMTDAERRLWSRLRDHRLEGWSFRRQHPIPPYVVDFACADARLIIEVDGGQHAGSRGDARRDQVLNGLGWRVLRFWNNDVLVNTEAVLATVLAALGPHPNPPPP
jgi:primosomal protein N' (replication factor Y)